LYDLELFGPVCGNFAHTFAQVVVVYIAELFNNPMGAFVQGSRVVDFQESKETFGGVARTESDSAAFGRHLCQTGSHHDVETVLDVLSLHSKLADSHGDGRVQTLRAAKVRTVQETVIEEHQAVDIEASGEGFGKEHEDTESHFEGAI